MKQPMINMYRAVHDSESTCEFDFKIKFMLSALFIGDDFSE